MTSRKISFLLTLFFLFQVTSLPYTKKLTLQEKSPGELSRFHLFLSGPTKCSSCHDKPGEISPGKCLNCHLNINSRIKLKRGYHQDKGEDCALCHAEHSGLNTSLIDFDPTDFDHSETGWPLRGSHTKIINCRSCHSKERIIQKKMFTGYLLKANTCSSCHTSPHPGLKTNCSHCHSNINWIVDPWRLK